MVFVPVVKTVAPTSGQVVIKEVSSFEGNILGAWNHLGMLVVVTDKGAVYHGNRRLGDLPGRVVAAVGFTGTGKPVTAHLQGVQPVLTDVTAKAPVDCGLTGDAVMSYDGALYLKNGDKIVHLGLVEVGSFQKVIVGPEVVANVLEHATKFHDGLAIQNLLGATYVSLFPTKGTHHQIRIPELDGYKVTETKFDSGVLMVLGSKNKGTYDRLVIRFDEDFTSYDVRVVPDITPTGLNFVTLDTGICVSMTEDENLEVFSRVKGASKVRVVVDSALAGDMKLCKLGGKVGFTRGDRLFSLSLK